MKRVHGMKAGRGSFISVRPVQLPRAPCLEGPVIASVLTVLKNFGTGGPAFSFCTGSANCGAASGSSCHSLITQLDAFHRRSWVATEARRWELRLRELWPLLELEFLRQWNQNYAFQNVSLTRYSEHKGFCVK